MKKQILVLLVLLFLLIATCVYQNTSVFYAKYHTNNTSTIHTDTPLTSRQKTMQETLIKKIRKEAVKAVIIKTKKETVPSIKTTKQILAKPLPTAQKGIEKIDTLMRALKERKVAFKNRDAFELHLEQLITKALEDRSATITHMNKERLHLLELQNELLRERDIIYNKSKQTNTPKSGE